MAEINIPINAEVQGLLDKLNLIKSDIEKISVSAKSAGETINKGFSGNNLKSTNKELQRTNGLIDDIEESLKEWEQAKKKATKIEDIEKYNRKIADGKKELQEYNTKGLPALKNVNNEATKGQSIFAGLGAKIATAFSVYAVINFAKTSLMAYNEQLKSENKLKAALGERGAMFETLKKQSEDLQATTAIDDATILSVQSFLAVQGRTEDQIKKVTETALDLSVVLGTDVNTTAMMLDQTFEGTIGRLGKFDDKLKTLTDSELANGDAVDLLAKKYKGMAEDSATSIDKLKVKWDEFIEGAGSFIYGVFFETGAEKQTKFEKDGANSAIGWIDGFKKAFKGAELQKQITEELEAQKTTLSELEKQMNLPGFKNMPLKDANPQFIALSYNIGQTKEKIIQLKTVLTGDKKDTAIDYTKLTVEKLNDLLESATKSEAKLIKAELERREKSEASAKEYAKSVIDGEYLIMQQKIDLQEDGTKKLIMTEALRYQKEKDSLKNSIKDKEQLNILLENAEKIHTAKLNKISEDAIATAKKTDKEDEETALKLKEEKLQAEYDLEKALIDYRYAGTEEQIKQKEQDLMDIELQFLRDKLDAKIITQEEYEALYLKQTGEANKKKAEKEQEAEKENAKKIKEIREQMLEDSLESAFKLLENFSERQLNKEEADSNRKYTKEEEALKKKLDSGKITQEKYDAELKRLKEQKDKSDFELEVKKFKRSQQMSIAEIAMDTAVQTAKILSTIAVQTATGFGLALTPVAIAQLVALGASSALQTAIVLSAPAPTFAKGGKLGGAYHSEGGTLVEAEKDEWFINRLSSKKYDSVLDNINKDNSFGALKELARLNGININHNSTNELKEKERLASAINIQLNEVKEIKEIRDILKSQKGEITRGNGYYIETKGNIKRKIYEA